MVLPGEKLKLFNDIAKKRFPELYDELQELKIVTNTLDGDFQNKSQKMNRYREVSKTLIRKVAIELIAHK